MVVGLPGCTIVPVLLLVLDMLAPVVMMVPDADVADGEGDGGGGGDCRGAAPEMVTAAAH